MAKEISEKTFELNITNELLNLSKSFIWYLHHSPFHHLLPEEIWRSVFTSNELFVEGLTQQQESQYGGGYDVSININRSSQKDKRLMFLQFKSGIRKNFRRNNRASHFHISKKPAPHIEFNFNDAADRTQHIILRGLANQHNVPSEAVLYVFPRITEKDDFHDKIGQLIWHTTFFPVLDIDKQGASQTPKIIISKGTSHKFRTSYDGTLCEVNLLLLLLIYDNNRIQEILGELIAIQIERFLTKISSNENPVLKDILSFIQENFILFVDRFINEENRNTSRLQEIVLDYVRLVSETLSQAQNNNEVVKIPSAPNRFTIKINKSGIFTLKFEESIDLSSIQYQIF